MTYLDLDAIRKRSDDYLGLADRMDDGRIPGLNSQTTAAAIGFLASLTAADVPDLLDEVERLRAELED